MNITDEMLYQYAGEARDLWLSTLPQKNELQPVPYSGRFKRLTKALIKTAGRSPKNDRVIRYVKRSVAAVLVIALLSFGGLMTVEAYREKVIEIMVQVFHDLTCYRFVSSAEERELSAVEFGYMPEGMELSEEILTGPGRYVRYTNADGKFFELNQIAIAAGDDSGSILDTEDSVIEVFEIRGNEAVANMKHGSTFIFWTEGHELFELSGDITVEELRRVAENLKIFTE